ncbi:uncharacterized protein LOC142488352 isoform X2 [Ascaphus truei]|uniref:uncharacterized protein LOC142488352 isoform X2 n=1 Tax=Ascaphus truei TaxID=8439 RepID=UPI003F59D5FD
MDPHLSFPVVVPEERLEVKSETEETDTEERLIPIKSEIDSFPVRGFPVIVSESLEMKSETEDSDTEDHLTQINREVVTFPVDGFPVVVPEERLEIKSEREEADTGEHLIPIKSEIDSFPIRGFPVIVSESLEMKSETEDSDTEEHLTPKNREVVTFPVGENSLNEEQNWSSDMSRIWLAPHFPNNHYSCHMLDNCKEPLPHDGFPVVVPEERLEIKSMTEETDTEEHLTPIKREIDSFPVEGFPVIVTESLEIKSEKEEPDTEDLLTQINRVVVTFPVDGCTLRTMDHSTTEKLISEVFRRVPLWNQRSRAYHDRYIHDRLWKEIGEILSIPTDLAKGKWKNLRDSFRRELKKIKPSDSGDEATSVYEKTSSWPFFKQMEFLKEQMTRAFAVPNRDVSEVDVSGEVTLDEESYCEAPVSLEPKPKKMKNSCEFKKQLICLEDKKLEIITNAFRDNADEDLHFFKSLLPYIKKLDPIKKLMVRLDIQAAVLKAMQDN